MNMPEHLYFRIECRENARQRLRAEVGVYRIGVILFNYPLKLRIFPELACSEMKRFKRSALVFKRSVPLALSNE